MSKDNQENLLFTPGIRSQGFGIVCKLPMRDPRLTPEAKAIYAYMCSFAGAGNTAFPSVDAMCRELGMGEKRFYKHRAYLEAYGYIKIYTRRNGNRNESNLYEIVDQPNVDEEKLRKLIESEELTVIQFDPRQNDSGQTDPRQNDSGQNDGTIINSINNQQNNNQQIKKQHTHGGSASASKATLEKVAVKTARVCENEESFNEFLIKFYKPANPTMKRKAGKEWDKLIEGGRTPEQIVNALNSYIAMKKADGVETRYWVNVLDFLTTWVDFKYPKAEQIETNEKPRKEGTPADPSRVAALQAKLRDKYEWPEYATCSFCGGKMYRKDDSNNYHCSTEGCTYVKAVKPTRTA